ncbi:hypothetical protein [uncultured Rikenella sp.]|uniref:hypothetical protein n=1 Tax=uncultured Rikenella sp. TaxID=368003 RepID=UPI00261595B7|nr:hypothetical protein [uncultured Rikenella sp.]
MFWTIILVIALIVVLASRANLKEKRDEIIRIKEQIQDEIKNMNRQMQQVGNLINQYNGICSRNIEQVAITMQDLQHSQQIVQRLLDSLSASQQNNLSVPWMDGRYLPLFMWDGSFRLVMTQFNQAIQEFERNPQY